MRKTSFIRRCQCSTGVSSYKLSSALVELLKQQPGNVIAVPHDLYNPDGDPDDDDVLVEFLAGSSYVRVAFRHDDRDCYVAAISLVNRHGQDGVALRVYDDKDQRFVDDVQLEHLIDNVDEETVMDFACNYAVFEPERLNDMNEADVKAMVMENEPLADAVGQIVRTYAQARFPEDSDEACGSILPNATERVRKLLSDILIGDSF